MSDFLKDVKEAKELETITGGLNLFVNFVFEKDQFDLNDKF